MRAKTPDLIGGSILVALGMAFAAGGAGYGIFGEGGRIGPGFMPFAAGVLLVLFGLIIGVQGLLGGGAEPPGETATAEDAERRGHPVGIAFGLMLVTILITPVIGFLPAFGLLILALVTFVEREGWLRGISLSVGAIALTWVAFVLLLNIPLPTGVIGQALGF